MTDYTTNLVERLRNAETTAAVEGYRDSVIAALREGADAIEGLNGEVQDYRSGEYMHATVAKRLRSVEQRVKAAEAALRKIASHEASTPTWKQAHIEVRHIVREYFERAYL